MIYNLFQKKKTSYYIKYRWVIDGYNSSWGIYRRFSNKEKRDEFFRKLMLETNKGFEEYKIN